MPPHNPSEHPVDSNLNKASLNKPEWAHPTAILLAVVGLAAIVRFAGIHSQSFFYDEVVTRNFSFSSFHDLLLGIVRDNGNPPLYWILIKAWSLAFGTGESALRTFSVTAGVLSTALVFQIAREYFDLRVAVIASVLYALAPFSLELSTEARCYAWLQLVALACFYCFLRFWIRDQAPWLGGVLICTVLLTFTHYYGFFIPLAQLIILLTFRQWRKLLAWSGAMAVAACIFAVGWLPVFLAQLRQPGNGTRGGAGWVMQFLATPLAFGVGRSLAWKGTVPFAALAAISLLVVVVFWLPVVWFGQIKCIDARLRFSLLIWLVLPVIVPLVVALLGHPIYEARYAMIALPAFALAYAGAVAHLTARQQAWALAAAFVLVAASLAGFYTHPIKDDWNRATAFLASGLKPGDVVLVDSDEEVVTLSYQARKLGLPETAEVGIMEVGKPLFGVPWMGTRKLSETPHDESAMIRRPGHVWLMVTGPNFGDRSDLPVLEAAGCTLSTERHFYRIDVYELGCPAP